MEAKPPPWLGKENPEWRGNFRVKYWCSEWKSILFNYLDKVLDQGFQGVYLDRVDVFEYWSNPANGEDTCLTEEEAAKRMIELVKEIAYYCRVVRGKEGFYVIPQNGERLLEYDYDGSYLKTISGVGVEDLFYDGLNPQPEEEVRFRVKYLDRVVKAGKLVLVVDYVDDGSGYRGANKARINDFRAKSIARGYIPYVARVDRELDELNVIDGVQPPLRAHRPLIVKPPTKSLLDYLWRLLKGL